MKNIRGVNLAIAVLSSVLFLTLGFGYIQINNNKIAKNTYIKDVNVSNLNKKEAREKILKECKIEKITLTYNDRKWDIDPKDIDINYDIDKTIENAYNVNRNSNIFKNIVSTLKSNFGVKNDINLVVDCDEAKATSTLENISKDINVKMENAKLNVTNNNINVIEEKAGIEVDIKTTLTNLKKSLQDGVVEESLVVTKVEPEIKTEDLKDVNTLLGSYQTVLSDVSPGRVENIKIATSRTSNVLLMPGEEFSYNKYTGLRTVKNGYKNATVILSGEPAQGVGGGVCQVSTTLYNAVLYAGLDIVKVYNHSIPSSYVEKGRDAVVSDNGLDFVFKNNYNQPIYIQNYYYNGVVSCQIYGSIKDKKNIKISTSIDKITKASIKEEKDPTLEKGKEKIIERGRDSYTVSTYRIYYDSNGKEEKREKVSTSFYPSKQQVVAVGTKEENEEKPSKEEENNTSNNDDNSTNNNSDKDENNSGENNDNKNDDVNNNNGNDTSKDEVPVEE